MSRRVLPRILYGFLSASAEPINPKLPWQPSDKDGLFKYNYSTIRADYDNIVSWIKTNKGERVMDFEFGLDVRRSLFEPEIKMKDILTQNAREQFPVYFKSLTLEEFSILTADDDSSLAENSVRIIVKAKSILNREVFIEVEEVIS